jgi:hypothetical protein
MSQSGYTAIIPYRSTTAAATPSAGNMSVGEIAINVTDRVLYTKNNSGDVVAISGGATGGGGDQVFVQNQLVVTTNYTLSTGFSAMSVGPITINGGVTVTIPSGHSWVVL